MSRSEPRHRDPLSPQQRDFAKMVDLVLNQLAADFDTTTEHARLTVERLLRAALVLGRRGQRIRDDLPRLLEPSLEELDRGTRSAVVQAERLAELRERLLRSGAYSYDEIAQGRKAKISTARQSIRRARERNELFTVTYGKETLVPAFLLDDSLEPRPEAQPAIAALRSAGEDGWALWSWFASPSSWLGERVPAEVLQDDPKSVATAARRRASNVE